VNHKIKLENFAKIFSLSILPT